MPGTSPSNISDDEFPWLPLFPFDKPYSQQVSGIDEFLTTLADNGYYAIEGACGTGKTLIGLVGAAYAMERGSLYSHAEESTVGLPTYSRTVAITPVKQQLKQFIAELRAINHNLPADSDYSELDGLVLRGMRDMMAYTVAEEIDFRWNAQSALAQTDIESSVDTLSTRELIDRLRANSRELIKAGSPVSLAWDGVEPDVCSVSDCRHLTRPRVARCPYHMDADDDEDAPWYDIIRAERVVDLVESLDGDALVIDGVETPYRQELPLVLDVAERASETGQLHKNAPFDPFYAKAVAGLSSVRFSDGTANVLDREALIQAAVADGCCPHTVMGRLASRADVVIGNYNHFFDPETRQLTAGKAGLYDEETILIVDEAHRVEDRVRDLLSDEISPYALQRARRDIVTAGEILTDSFRVDDTAATERAQDAARKILDRISQETGITVTEQSLKEAVDFLDWFIDALDELVVETLSDEYANWERAIGNGSPEQDSFPLEDPENPDQTDVLSRRFHTADDWSLEYLQEFTPVCEAASQIHSSVTLSNREAVADAVGESLRHWTTADSVTYYRELKMEHSPHQEPPNRLPEWIESITPRLHLFNTVPSDRVAALYDEVGGGIVMSATLEPLDDYLETAGLAPLENTDSETLAGREPAGALASPSDIADRPVNTNTYELTFPEENRASWVLDLPRYTYDNRGKPTQTWEEMSPTRKQYARALREIAASWGNHLVAMPNYREAQWLGTWLKSHEKVNKSIYIDNSSTSAETTDLLDEFFAEGHSVLITSSLGTVTEGVDYDGNKLHCATVVGVPYRNTQSGRAQAIIDAYDRAVADDSQSGFDTAVRIPAVRKARQAIGRVLRSPDEHGIRIFADERYNGRSDYDVGQYLSPAEYDELQRVDPDMLSIGFDHFWGEKRREEMNSLAERESTDTPNGGEKNPATTGTETAAETETEPSLNRSSPPESLAGISKMYFGTGSDLSGWVEVETEVAVEEIVPLVEEHHVESDPNADGIQMMFSKDLSIDGWVAVDFNTVREEIEPIASRSNERL